jgi:UDP-3-O-[3-hydroxymyristoyl] glucosamine N-acyltransferase
MATVGQLAKLVGGTVIGEPDREIRDVADLSNATAEHLSFLANLKYRDQFAKTRAGAVLCTEAIANAHTTLIVCADPYLSLARIATHLHPPPRYAAGIEAGAFVAASAVVDAAATVRVGAIIDAGARVGARTIIGPGAYVGAEAVVGEDCLLHPNANVLARCRLGDRVILHAGVVIGSDGFGYAPDAHGARFKIPQLGVVVLENDVEIGANTTVDRATFGETRIGAGTKIDNLVQIAHNVVTGEDCVIVSQCGIAGSTRIGRKVIMGAGVGVVGHIHIADGVMLGARTGVPSSIDEPGIYSGTPAMPHREWLKTAVLQKSLPDLRRKILALERRLAELEREARPLPQ